MLSENVSKTRYCWHRPSPHYHRLLIFENQHYQFLWVPITQAQFPHRMKLLLTSSPVHHRCCCDDGWCNHRGDKKVHVRWRRMLDMHIWPVVSSSAIPYRMKIASKNSCLFNMKFSSLKGRVVSHDDAPGHWAISNALRSIDGRVGSISRRVLS